MILSGTGSDGPDVSCERHGFEAVLMAVLLEPLLPSGNLT